MSLSSYIRCNNNTVQSTKNNPTAEHNGGQNAQVRVEHYEVLQNYDPSLHIQGDPVYFLK